MIASTTLAPATWLTLLIILLALAAAPVGGQGVGDDYGAEEANTRFFFEHETVSAEDDYNYLALRDHHGPSGVPLGGIGVGCIDLAPDGHFTRLALNNTHKVLDDPYGRGCFFSLYSRPADGPGHARRLARDEAVYAGMRGYAHSTYTGLFPRAEITFDDGPDTHQDVAARVHAYAPIVPHNVKDSALPIVWFDIELTARTAATAAVALAWEDLIGAGIYDASPAQVAEFGRKFQARNANAPAEWEPITRPATTAAPVRLGGLTGVLQAADGPFQPNKATFQNYNTQIAVLAEPQADATITCLPAFTVDEPDAAWAPFVQTGRFPDSPGSTTALSQPGGPARGSAVAVTVPLAAGQTRTIRFALAWFMPEMVIDRATAPPGSYWGNCDYGRYYHNFFDNLDGIVRYAAGVRADALAATRAWQQPVLASTWPDWLKFKIINSAYTIVTNTMLNRAGEFTVMEGAMGGWAGTMDQRISAHPFYQKFFTELDRTEMQMFADRQEPEGFILHFIGHYYVGMASHHSPALSRGHMLDNTGGWIIQLAKDYAQSGDLAYLRHNHDHVRRGLAFLRDSTPGPIQIPVGNTTYDDYDHPPIYSYTAGMYLATLNAGAAIGAALGDDEMVRQCREQFDRTGHDALKYLWNGRFFAYGCEPDGSGRRDNIVFSGQVAGQFMSRYCGWGDIYPLDVVRASLVTQFKTSLAHSPDYYANKVWDLDQMKGIDRPGSQCWPFYLESYTAMNGMMAGYVADGLDIMRHIQLVHMRKGWTWCQNLWNPGPITYMTMPVTWFVTDVLAGAQLDVPGGTLTLAPIRDDGGVETRSPLYFPRFWAELHCVPARRQVQLRILRTFGITPARLRHLASEPAGRPTSQRRVVDIPEFVVRAGAVLDLSDHWDLLDRVRLRQAVLPRAAEVDFITVEAPWEHSAP